MDNSFYHSMESVPLDRTLFIITEDIPLSPKVKLELLIKQKGGLLQKKFDSVVEKEIYVYHENVDSLKAIVQGEIPYAIGCELLMKVLENSMPFPEKSVVHALFTERFYCSKNVIAKVISLMGGDIVGVDERPDIAICDNVLDPYYSMMMEQNILILNEQWVSDCVKVQKYLPREKYSLKVFTGLTFCVTGYNANRNDIEKVVEQNGGVYHQDLDKECNILLVDYENCDKGSKSKYNYARKHKLDMVNLDWIHRCIGAGFYTKPKDWAMDDPIFSQNSWPHSSITSQGTPIFENFTFYLYGLDDDVKEEYYEVIRSNGGRRGSIDTSTHIIIINYRSFQDEINSKFILARENAFMLEFDWLCECIEKKRLIRMDNFLIKNNPKKRKYDQPLEYSHQKKARTSLFQNINFLLVIENIKPKAFDKTKNLVEENGGTFFKLSDNSSDLIDYIIENHGAGDTRKKARYFNIEDAQIVSNLWLQHSITNDMILGVDEFLLYRPLPRKRKYYKKILMGTKIYIDKEYRSELKYLELLCKILGAERVSSPEMAHSIITEYDKFNNISCEKFRKEYLQDLIRHHGIFEIQNPIISQKQLIIRDVSSHLLSDVYFCVSKDVPDNKTEDLKMIAKEMGAKYNWTVDNKTTHFIHEGKAKLKKELGTRINEIHIVAPLWLFKCYEENEKQPENLFPCEVNPKKNLSSIIKMENPTISRRKQTKKEEKVKPPPKIIRNDFLPQRNTSPEIHVPIKSYVQEDKKPITKRPESIRTDIQIIENINVDNVPSITHNVTNEHNIPRVIPILEESSDDIMEIDVSIDNDLEQMEVFTGKSETTITEEAKYVYHEKYEGLFDNSSTDSEDFDHLIPKKYIQFAASQMESQADDVDTYFQSQVIIPYDPNKSMEQKLRNGEIIGDFNSNESMFLENIQKKPEISQTRTKTFNFQFSGFSTVDDLKTIITQMGGNYSDDKYIRPETTHLIVAKMSASIKIMAACCKGLWVLRTDYLYQSYQKRRFINEEPFEWVKLEKTDKDLCNAPRRWRKEIEETGIPPFFGWKLFLLSNKKEALAEVLKAGGAEILEVQEENLTMKILSSEHVYALVEDDGNEQEKKLIKSKEVNTVNRKIITERIVKSKSEFNQSDFKYNWKR